MSFLGRSASAWILGIRARCLEPMHLSVGAALEQIGGYQPGLTEDLATSIELHSAKWSSRYVHEPLAPGLSPADLRGFFVQQFKWALGVFGLLFIVYPARFFSMTWRQRLCYLTRMTCYLAGPYCAAHILLAFFLLFGSGRTHDVFVGYALRYLPLFAVILIIQAYSVHLWSREPARLRWRAISLVYSTWPVYVAALFCAMFRWKVDYLPTPKVFQRETTCHLRLHSCLQQPAYSSA